MSCRRAVLLPLLLRCGGRCVRLPLCDASCPVLGQDPATKEPDLQASAPNPPAAGCNHPLRHCSTPVGGLTLALSRESSVKGGQAACPSRERSVRDGSVRSGSVRSGSCNPAAGDSPLERSVSGGQRTYRGLLLADSRPGQPGHHMRRLEEAFACGSAEWTHGQAAGIPLTDMVG